MDELPYHAQRTHATKPKLTAIAVSHLILLLVEGEHTIDELSAGMGFHRNTVVQYVRALKNRKLIYIAGFDPDKRGTCQIPVYAWGPGKKDAVFKRKPANIRQAEHRARKRLAHIHTAIAGPMASCTPGQQTGAAPLSGP